MRCVAQYCNERQSAEDAVAKTPRPLCISKGHIRGALRKKVEQRGFKHLYEYFVRGNPWCQCRVRAPPALATPGQAEAAGVPTWAIGDVRGGSSGRAIVPCMLPQPRCCLFGGQTLQDVIRDARAKAYPSGCAPWFNEFGELRPSF